VTVSTYADLKMYAESTTASVIRVQGTIANGANGGKVSIKSNKTIVGVGSTAFLNGVGLEIASSDNVIIQNLRMTMMGVTTRVDTPGVYTSSDDEGLPAIQVNGGDVISISGTSKNIWIDHCELYNEDPAVQTNHDLYDGLIDVKGQTGFITISWCYLHDHHKGGLVGASDTDLYDDRKITFHHNDYNKVVLRIPIYRGAVGHSSTTTSWARRTRRRSARAPASASRRTTTRRCTTRSTRPPTHPAAPNGSTTSRSAARRAPTPPAAPPTFPIRTPAR
jgi:pectate lyase